MARRPKLAARAGIRVNRGARLPPPAEDVTGRPKPPEPPEEPEGDGVEAHHHDQGHHLRPPSLAAYSSYAPATASASIPSFASAWRAASCSAAFFDRPLPTPTCSPSIVAAQVKLRSCGGPSTSTTV